MPDESSRFHQGPALLNSEGLKITRYRAPVSRGSAGGGKKYFTTRRKGDVASVKVKEVPFSCSPLLL